MAEWYPQNSKELNRIIEEFLSQETNFKGEIHGLIVPHAGYEFSGAIAGKAFSLLKNKKMKRAIVLGPSHYVNFSGVRALDKIHTPFGKIKILKNDFGKIKYEHSVENQIPFLQKLNFKEVLPLVIGEISNKEAGEIAKKISKIDAIYIFSTDLSHFLPYEESVKKDEETIKIIENLDFENFEKIDACGKFPLLIMMHLCKLTNWKPKLIEYKNSGDIIGDKNSVVGYASFLF
ncbi:AmmeMemoRadiSam system protein B [Candidatus Pacearchaeota archaeon]|nr:AmmeMemoRadiSam system protein B [Candidatus Pacearchaeota archaeon]